jgi:purine-cytosine permease-like protein
MARRQDLVSVNQLVIDLVFCALLWLVFGWRVMFVTVAIMVIIGVFLGIYIRRVLKRKKKGNSVKWRS